LKGLRCEVDRWIDLVDDKNQWPVILSAEHWSFI
jgi:hypothetical protein